MAQNTTTTLNTRPSEAGLVRYPSDLGTAPAEKWMLFEVKAGRHIGRTGTVGVGNNPDRTLKSVALYLPPDALQSTLSVNWKEDNYGVAAGAAVQAAIQNRAGDINKIASVNGAINEIPELAPSVLSGVLNGLKASFAEAVGKVTELATAGAVATTQQSGLLGATANPRTDLFFDAVAYREHSFSFTMIPRNRQEAVSIDQILNTFQFYMLPTFGNSAGDNAFFIGYPYEFQIYMFTQFTGGHHINTIDRSVLTSVSISHGSGGRVAFVDEGAKTEYYPATTQLTLNFKEVRLQGRNNQTSIWRGAGTSNGKPNDLGQTSKPNYPDPSIYSS